MNINRKLAEEFHIRESQVDATIKLIDEGSTIPFIARYRKEVTGSLSDEVLRDLDTRLSYLRSLEERKAEVKKLIEEQGKLTPELSEEIEKAEVLQRVEDLYKPFKQKKTTRAGKAKARGLEPLAMKIYAQLDTEGDPLEVAESFVDPEKEVETPEAALVREIREELDSEIEVEQYLTTVEHDYPEFHLSMDCYWCKLKSGRLTLIEHEAAKWLPLDNLRQVNWLPADVKVVEAIELRGAILPPL